MYYPYFWILSVLLQIVFIVHVVMRRNDYFWIFIILFFPMVGCAVYAIMIWIPDMRHSRAAHGTSKAVLSVLDPRRDLRKRLDRLDVSDTVENRVSLAKELTRHGMGQDALSLYERSLKGMYEHDPYLLLGYASALFEAGMLPAALEVLDRLWKMNPDFRSQEAQLLHARVFEGMGDDAQASRQYEKVVRGFAGIEARCRYAQFLKKQGKLDEAKPIFEDILRNARHSGSHSRRLNREWIGIAKRELAS